jgi:hypothetical protein
VASRTAALTGPELSVLTGRSAPQEWKTKRIDSNEWSQLVATGTDYLAELAEQSEHAEYGQFNDRVCGGLFYLGDASERDQLGRLLGDISRASVREYGVMLSALVHHKGNVLDVGKGFFILSADMGRLDPKADDVTRTVFLGREIEAAHEKFGGR